jgi:hypothetical protein
MLLRTAAAWLVGQLLVTVVLSSAVPGGASLLVLAGFVTPGYDHNLFAVRVTQVPWTDPVVWFSVQSVVQNLVVAATAASLVTLFHTNYWQHGVLADSTPPPRPRRTEGTGTSGAPLFGGPADTASDDGSGTPPVTGPPGGVPGMGRAGGSATPRGGR